MPDRASTITSLLGGRDYRGSLGNIGGILTEQQYQALPDWLRSQFQARYDNDDNGSRFIGYENYDLRDQQGNAARLIDQSNAFGDPRHNNNWNDPSQLRYDPALGLVSTPGNMTDIPDASFTNGLRLTQLAVAAMAGAGAYEAMGAGGTGGGWNGSFGEFGGLDPETLSGLGGMGEGPASTGLFGQLPNIPPSTVGEFGPGFEGLGEFGDAAFREQMIVNASRLPAEGGLFGPEAFAGLAPFVPPALNAMSPGFEPLGDPPAEKPWFDNMGNPLQTLGRLAGLLQMGRGLFGNDNTGNPGGGSGGPLGPAPTAHLNRGAFQRNPHTQRQLENFTYAQPRGR